MAKNQRRRVQEALFSPDPSTTPPEEEKAAERTETPEKPISDEKAYFKLNLSNDEREELERAYAALTSSPIRPIPPEEHISRTYGIEPNCTNVPRLLYAILCEVVRGRV